MIRVMAALCAVLIVAGCYGSRSTTVLDVSDTRRTFNSYTLERADSTVNVPSELVAAFEAELISEMAEAGFSQGGPLKMVYRFIRYEKGSQAKRYFLGFGSGTASATVEVRFFDEDDVELAKIQAEGELMGGFFGGDKAATMTKASKEVSEFAQERFGPPTTE